VKFKFLFVNNIPLLFESYRVAKQIRIEIWLQPKTLTENLGLKQVEKKKPSLTYIA